MCFCFIFQIKFKTVSLIKTLKVPFHFSTFTGAFCSQWGEPTIIGRMQNKIEIIIFKMNVY